MGFVYHRRTFNIKIIGLAPGGDEMNNYKNEIAALRSELTTLRLDVDLLKGSHTTTNPTQCAKDISDEARALAQHIEDNHKIDALRMENAEMREIIEKFLLLNPESSFELWDVTRFNAFNFRRLRQGGRRWIMTKKLYAERDHESQGKHYINHISAMTGEDLQSKSSIAGELAHRDIEIERLKLRDDTCLHHQQASIRIAAEKKELIKTIERLRNRLTTARECLK